MGQSGGSMRKTIGRVRYPSAAERNGSSKNHKDNTWTDHHFRKDVDNATIMMLRGDHTVWHSIFGNMVIRKVITTLLWMQRLFGDRKISEIVDTLERISRREIRKFTFSERADFLRERKDPTDQVAREGVLGGDMGSAASSNY